VKSIKGHFVRGFLNGPSFLGLQDTRWLLAEVKNGVMHGPQLLQAVTQILPVIEIKKYFVFYTQTKDQLKKSFQIQ
jgi:hypothetical protein